MALSSTQENERQLYDYGQYRIRQTLTTVPGSTLPSPYGGQPRQIMVDLDLHALQAYGLTPADVTSAMTAQNITVPSGLAKFGTKQYVIRLNSTPEAIATLNEVPVKVVNGSPMLVRDVAYVRDGGPPQQNIVRQDGMRGVLLTVLKNGNASTLVRGQHGEVAAAGHPGGGAEGHEDHAAVRPVGVRVRRDRRRDP